jgi:hypothetical protein
MSRLLAIWLTLLAAFWLTRALASALLFGTADRGTAGVLQLVAVPAVQALLVVWATRRPGPFAHALPVRAALGQADLRAILLLDAAVLALGWVLGTFWEIGWFGLAQGRNLPSTWTALKAGAAGVVLFPATRGARDEDRRWLIGFACALLALALMILFDVLRPLPELLFPGQPRLLRWLVVHGSLLAAGTGLVLRVQRIFRRSGRKTNAAGLALDWALGLALVAALVAVPHLVQRPYLTEPWASFAATCDSLAVTALLVAVLLGTRNISSPPSQ